MHIIICVINSNIITHCFAHDNNSHILKAEVSYLVKFS